MAQRVTVRRLFNHTAGWPGDHFLDTVEGEAMGMKGNFVRQDGRIRAVTSAGGSQLASEAESGPRTARAGYSARSATPTSGPPYSATALVDDPVAVSSYQPTGEWTVFL